MATAWCQEGQQRSKEIHEGQNGILQEEQGLDSRRIAQSYFL